jgi:hypothetical protein
MTPNDLEAYLAVCNRQSVGQLAMELPGGVKLNVVFMPTVPAQSGSDPTPGGWKSPQHLDDPADLRVGLEYKGELP